MSAIFPTVRRPSRSSSARATSSSGYSAGRTGSILPSATIASRSPRSARWSSACCMAQMPQSMPITVRLRSSTWLSGIEGMAPDGEADDEIAPTVAQRPQRRLGECATHGVDHDVDAGPAGPGPGRVLDRLGGRVEHRLGPGRPGRGALLLARRHAEHPAPERPGHADGGQPDAAAGPEHEHRLARLRRRPARAGRTGRCCSSG